MSLNYGTLKTQVLGDTHRTELTANVADFVRSAEGLIRRELRCSEMLTRVDLTDSDRVTADEGFYTLPTDYLEERRYYLINASTGDKSLQKVSLDELRRVTGSSDVRHFSIISKTVVEFRGVPSTTDVIELIYFAAPAIFSSDGDDNDILIYHEDIYLHAAKAALYAYTQDIELSAAHQSSAENAIEALNQQSGRVLGGARNQGYYNLTPFGGR